MKTYWYYGKIIKIMIDKFSTLTSISITFLVLHYIPAAILLCSSLGGSNYITANQPDHRTEMALDLLLAGATLSSFAYQFPTHLIRNQSVRAINLREPHLCTTTATYKRTRATDDRLDSHFIN